MSWRRHCPEPLILARVFRMLSMAELWVGLVSTLVALYAAYLQPKDGWPQITNQDYLVVFQLTSFAVALLLVFRTNSAYSRWWEVSCRRAGRPGQGLAIWMPCDAFWVAGGGRGIGMHVVTAD
jgi:hypothetical protein